MTEKALQKQVDILMETFSDSVGPCYFVNLSQNRIPGIMYHNIDGKRENVNEKIGLPENVRFSEVTAYFGQQLPQEEQADYFAFFHIPRLLDCFAGGERHVFFQYWTGEVFEKPILARRHLLMYADEETGDVLGLSYVEDMTASFDAAEYRRTTERKHLKLETDLYAAYQENLAKKKIIDRMNDSLDDSTAKLDTERGFLNVLCQEYMAVYHANLREDIAVALKMRSDTNLSKMPTSEVRKPVCYTKHIQDYCEKYIVAENQKDFLEFMEKERLLRELPMQHRCVFHFRCTPPNEAGQEYFEAQVIHVGEGEGEGNALITFRDIDHVVKAEHRHQIELEERLLQEQVQNELLVGISQIYYSIFRIDLRADTYEEIYHQEHVTHLMRQAGTASVELRKLCERFIVPQHREQMMQFFNMSTAAKRLRWETSVSAECMTMDGNWHQARLIAKRRDEKGEVTHILYVTRIISDEKFREERLISLAENANEANRAKTDFISQVAHDIRTPMNSIFGFLEIAEASLGDWQKVAYSLGRIRVAGEFLKDLVDDVLDITRMEDGRMKIEPEEVNLHQLLHTFSISMEQGKMEKQHEFHVHYEKILHEYIIVDPLRLKQIYANVMSNAIKYTPAGGRIDFTISQEEIPGTNRLRMITTIVDTGIGISEEFMEKMFSKFERGTDTRINRVNGYGLGLSIVKLLVDLMGGTIAVKSKLGEGTSFTITLELPYTDHLTEKVQQEDFNYAAVCEGMHLLVAEDNALNREVIIELLSMYHITCECAEDGWICVERFRKAPEGKYDAILMDMQMPHMNGIDAARKIRAMALPHAKTIPIIAMTANALKEDRQKCLQAGMNRHLSKPIDMNELMQALAETKK